MGAWAGARSSMLASLDVGIWFRMGRFGQVHKPFHVRSGAFCEPFTTWLLRRQYKVRNKPMC
jgi:hypothetical protein